MRGQPLLLTVSLAAGLLSLAACGGDGVSPTREDALAVASPSPSPSPSPTPTPTPTAVATPAQVSPPDGTVFANFPRTTTLVWAPVAGAVSYHLEVDCYHCCQSGAWCTDVGKQWTVRDLAATTYTFDWVGAQPGRWRVTAVDAEGRSSVPSRWWGFDYRV